MFRSKWLVKGLHKTSKAEKVISWFVCHLKKKRLPRKLVEINFSNFKCTLRVNSSKQRKTTHVEKYRVKAAFLQVLSAY